MVKNRYLYITLLAVLGLTPEAMAQGRIQYAPRLVVSVTIDQLRTDYMEAFAPLYGAGGFKRLLTQGLVYTNASYPYSPIDRASAMATLATGTTPYYHSVVGRSWLDKETLRPVDCTGATGTPDNLLVSTLGDELKVSTEGKAKIYSVAPFRDAAIMAAGHAADGVLWIDDESGLWRTSQYYSAEEPAWLVTFNQLSSPSATLKKTFWEPVMELSGKFNYYQHTGDHQPFKHKLAGADRYRQLKASGLVNAYVTSLALQCMGNGAMGYDRVTDLLSVTYYAGNYQHKPMSECPLELQDTYVRLDRELALLIEGIERRVGAEHVVFVVTSTGYSDAESADYEKYRVPTGTFYVNRAGSLLNMYFGAIWGQGRYVEACFRNQLLLNHKLLESKRVSLTDASLRAQEFLSQMAGVRSVYTALQLATTYNDQTSKVRHGFNPQRSGDILIEVAPGWQLLDEDTQTSELSRASFTQFPLVVYGAGVAADTVAERVTVDRLAPTLAKAIRIRAPNACSAEPLDEIRNKK